MSLTERLRFEFGLEDSEEEEKTNSSGKGVSSSVYLYFNCCFKSY